MPIEYRDCGCTAHFDKHNSWCSETPIFAQLVKENGCNPADTFPFLVFCLIGYSKYAK